MSKKNIFIVFGHPQRKSLNGAILDVAIETLTSLGHEVTVSDLHAMNFDPVPRRNDVKDCTKSSADFDWRVEMRRATKEGQVADYIKEERDKISAADLLILQFPLWWMSFPAIMKGWLDKVPGNTSQVPDKIFDKAGCKGKKAMLSFTAGGPEPQYGSQGLMGDMDITLWPIQSDILSFMGFEVLAPHIVYGLDNPTDAEEVFRNWADRLKTIFDEKPLHFYKLKDYDGGMTLKQDIIQSNKGPYGPTVGQHCGQPIPPGSQTQVPQ